MFEIIKKKIKNKKFITSLLVILILLNLITIIIISSDFNSAKAPQTKIKIDIIEINPQEAKIQTIIEMKNPNNFNLIIKNLKVMTYVSEGEKISSFITEGGVIPPFKNETFTTISTIDYKEKSLEVLLSEISFDGGFNIFFIEKTIPFSLIVETSIGELIEDFKSPTIKIKGEFNEISQKIVNISLAIETFNPNVFDISLNNTNFEIINEKNEEVGFINIDDVDISSGKTANFTILGTITIGALNAEELSINMNTNITATIAGYKKTIPFSFESTIVVPDLMDLLLSDIPTEAVIRGDYRLSLNGLVEEITLEIHNPNKIEIIAKDIDVSIYRIDKDIETIIGHGIIEDGILKPEDVTVLNGEIVIPYAKLIIPPVSGRIKPDWLKVQVKVNLTAEGLKNSWPVGMTIYQDLNLFSIQ